MFLKKRTEDAECRYKKYKNKLVLIIRKQKKDYYIHLIDKSKGSIKNTWGVINKVLHKGRAKIITPDFITKNNSDKNATEEIANEFNNYFANIGSNLVQYIPDENIDGSIIPHSVNSIFLERVQVSEILKIVYEFANKKSNDYTDMNMSLIKQIIDVIVEPFTYICNLSFTTGKFPERMKIAKVVPLFKKGNKNDVSNYRPISLLPQLSKIFEKLFVFRLKKKFG